LVFVLVPVTVLKYLSETGVCCDVLHFLLLYLLAGSGYYLPAKLLISAALLRVGLGLILVIILGVIERLGLTLLDICNVGAANQPRDVQAHLGQLDVEMTFSLGVFIIGIPIERVHVTRTEVILGKECLLV
jgi:hypothetical protein